MRRALTGCGLTLALGAALAQAGHAQELGPLFFTPAQRRHLEAARLAPTAQPAHADPARTAGSVRDGQTRRVQGAIVAQGSRGVAGWLDGERFYSGDRVETFTVQVEDGSVRLVDPARSALQAPVGASVDLVDRSVRQPVRVERSARR